MRSVGRIGMSKHQPRIEEIPAADLLPSYNDVLDLAISSGLTLRDSNKFCPHAFLLVLIQSTITGESTLESLAADLGEVTKSPMSRSGLFQRFDDSTVKFLMSVLYQVLSDNWELSEPLKRSLPFFRILIEDSTQLRLNPKNAEDFKAHGNGSGVTAGCKIDFCYDLISSSIVDMSLHSATAQDRDLGKDMVDLAQDGDCYLRDMGYYIAHDFELIEQAGAFWLSRLPAGVQATFTTEEGDVISLEKKLLATKEDSLDIMVKAGKDAQKSARLVAIKADKATIEKRRRERNKRDEKSGKKSSKLARERDNWHIMVTNIDEEMMTVKQLGELYRLRWNIELCFKAWKQSGSMHIALSRKANSSYLESLVLASMIRFALNFRPLSSFHHVERLSMGKLFKRMSKWISDLRAGDVRESFKVDIRHIQMDLRSRSTLDELLEELITSLA